MLSVLDRLEPRLDHALVSRGAWTGVRALGATLPPELVDGVYLECRLAPTAETVDVVVRVPRESAGMLAGTNPAIALPAACTTSPEWQAVGALAREWTDRTTLISQVVDHLWLEFDITPPGTATATALPPAPSVFLAFDLAVTRHLGPAALANTIHRALEPLGADALPPNTWPSLRRALGALPPGTAVPYVGVMLARGGGLLRLYVALRDEGEWTVLLRTVEWPGCARTLITALTGLSAASPSGIGMGHIDFGYETSPRVGFEFTLDRRSQLRGQVRESALLDVLVAQNLCSPAKMDALHRWPGYERGVLPHQLWESILIRRVNCIKVVALGHRIIEAKGYLLGYHRPFGNWMR
jgi:hypothetical protein